MDLAKRSRAALLAGLLLLGATWGLAPPTSARGGPPKAILHAGDERQRGEMLWFTSGRHHGNGQCSVFHGDAVGDWPAAISHGSDQRLRVGFPKDAKPDEVRMWGYRQTTPSGGTVGESEDVPLRLRPRRVDGEIVGWKVMFKRSDVGHHYLRMYARWSGRHDCTFVETLYQFHTESMPDADSLS